jgi:hypothetical protein
MTSKLNASCLEILRHHVLAGLQTDHSIGAGTMMMVLAE